NKIKKNIETDKFISNIQKPIYSDISINQINDEIEEFENDFQIQRPICMKPGCYYNKIIMLEVKHTCGHPPNNRCLSSVEKKENRDPLKKAKNKCSCPSNNEYILLEAHNPIGDGKFGFWLLA
ncbi:30606_t:CDS:2, partial [Gigaspora margarita]